MRQPAILMWHWFRESGKASTSKSPQLEITPERFDAQLRSLARSRFRSFGLSQAFDLAERGELPRRSLVITFDDGTRDFWEHARPALARHGFTASLFIVAGHVGGASTWDEALGEPARPLLDWEQIRELAAEGHEIGSHTLDHLVLPELERDEALRQMTASRQLLEAKLDRPVEWLAYPRGFHGPREMELAREAGYRGACAVAFGLRELRQGRRYALQRMTIKGNESIRRFKMRLWLARRVPLVD